MSIPDSLQLLVLVLGLVILMRDNGLRGRGGAAAPRPSTIRPGRPGSGQADQPRDIQVTPR